MEVRVWTQNQVLSDICLTLFHTYCKKIRDNKEFWNQVERYINRHTDAKFTHGICPDCAKELYGNADDKVNEDQKKKNI